MRTDKNQAQRKILEEITAGFPALAREVQDALKLAHASQQKLAAHASMLQAYGWPIPAVEGLTIQSAPLPPAAHQALLQAVQQANGNPPVVVPAPPVTSGTTIKAERGSVRKLVNKALLARPEMTVKELHDHIRDHDGVRLGMSSIYRILSRNKSEYRNNAGKWEIKK